MQKLFETVAEGNFWFFDTGWNIWSDLFALLPYGDPYIAIVAAMMVIYMTNKPLISASRPIERRPANGGDGHLSALN